MAAGKSLTHVIAGTVAGMALAAVALPVAAAPSTWVELDGNIVADAPSATVHDWANSGAATPTNGCPPTPGVVNISGTGGLFNCGSPGAAGAPPNPPTLTPAATANTSIVSSVFVVDPLSSDTTAACGSGDPTSFGGGLKNGDAINSFTYATGSSPGKNDLGNVYAVSRIRADGHHELFFAAERILHNGDSHMDFEFLQSTVSRTGTCSGSFSGHRTQGDLLLAVDFTNGGTLASNSLYVWHCNADPGLQPATGTVCDPSGGSPVPHYELITAPPGSLTFLVNAATIACGGWVCRDSSTGNSTQIAADDFMEGGVDLQVLPFTGCFNTLLPHTRTAQSFTSALTDFAGPLAFHSCRAPAIPGLPNTGLVDVDGPLQRVPIARDSPAPPPPSPPVRLSVPRLGIDAPIEVVGLDSKGALGSPSVLQHAAWYRGGSVPGDPGSAVIDGHLGVRPGQAAFWTLSGIRAGDVIVVTRGDGTRVRFMVDAMRRYPRTATVPALFTKDGPALLWLITCSGRWDYLRSTYDDRLVVHAHLVA